MQLQKKNIPKKLSGWNDNTLSSHYHQWYGLILRSIVYFVTSSYDTWPSERWQSVRHAEQQRTKHSKAGKPHRLGGDSAEEADTSWLRECEEELVTNSEATSVVWMWFGYEHFDKEQKCVLCQNALSVLPLCCTNASNYLNWDMKFEPYHSALTDISNFILSL